MDPDEKCRSNWAMLTNLGHAHNFLATACFLDNIALCQKLHCKLQKKMAFTDMYQVLETYKYQPHK
jgi:hypothetical protein